MANSYKPPVAPWDAKLALEALYHLLQYETNPSLRNKYLASLERYWMIEKENSLVAFHVVYAHFVPDNNGFNEWSLTSLVNWKGAWRQYRDELLRQEGGPERIKGIWQEPSHQYLRAYWSARYHNLLTENNKVGAGNPPEWAIPQKDVYEGMVFVPEGEFIMGSSIGDADEYPPRLVWLQGFYIDRFEVSNADYAKFKPDFKFSPEKADEPVRKCKLV